MAQKIEIHNRGLETRREGIGSWRIPESEKAELLRFLDQLGLGRVNKGFRVSEARQVKYLDVLRAPLEFFGKPTNLLTVENVEAFEKSLSSGTIQSNRAAPYAHSTKVDMRRALKVYFRWKLGAQKAEELTGWFDTRDKSKTPDYLKEADVERLLKACKCAEDRFLISVLFDSGARVTEFHNIRYEDVQLPRDDSGYVKITLKEEYSKTKGRNVALFWKHSKEAVRDYVQERERAGIKIQDPVFRKSYAAARAFLNRLGRKILGRSIHCHLFRHSSATYYADKMNRQQLCIRYGWAFSSRMPDIYISRAGVDSTELEQKFSNAEASATKESLFKMEQREKMKDDQIQQLQTMILELQQNFDAITSALQKNPTESMLRGAIKQVEFKLRAHGSQR